MMMMRCRGFLHEIFSIASKAESLNQHIEGPQYSTERKRNAGLFDPVLNG